MACTYIIYSKKIDSYYIGSCLDLDERLKDHNSGTYIGSFTAKANDWKIYFFLDNLSQDHSRKIEVHIKKMKSRKYIENLVKHPEIFQKLLQNFVGSSR